MAGDSQLSHCLECNTADSTSPRPHFSPVVAHICGRSMWGRRAQFLGSRLDISEGPAQLHSSHGISNCTYLTVHVFPDQHCSPSPLNGVLLLSSCHKFLTQSLAAKEALPITSTPQKNYTKNKYKNNREYCFSAFLHEGKLHPSPEYGFPWSVQLSCWI